MITVELLKSIDRLLPGADELSCQRRKLVRLLADAGGEHCVRALTFALGNTFVATMVAASGWEGLRLSGTDSNATLRLAPWVRKAVGLPVEPGELLSDLADDDEPSAYHRPALPADPLADVRATLARCRNISTPAEALEHAFPNEDIRVGIV